MHKKRIVLIALATMALVAMVVVWRGRASAPSNGKPAPTKQHAETPSPVMPTFDKTAHSTTDPASLWIIVNKVSPLPSSYAPADLQATYQGESMRAEAAAALGKLLASSTAAGNNMYAISGYRSYANQVSTYGSFVKADGQAKADTYSARPGHSEHQTGWAMDLGSSVCDLAICFGDTPAGKWLAAHAQEYGFIIRYPAGKEAITGYQYEPWHIRYVGVDLATELHKTGQTMEEFFGVAPLKQPY